MLFRSTFGVGVAVTFGVGVAVTFGVGVAVTFGVGVAVTFGVGVAVTFGVGATPDILIPYPAGSLTAMSFLPPGRMMPPLKTAFHSSCPREAGLIPAFLIRSRREVASVSTPCRLRTARPYPQESSRSPLAVCITALSLIHI